jgi:hypothetical protein
MKKTILALVLVITAIACDSAVENNKSTDSLTSPVYVDTVVPPVAIDTLVTVDGDTLLSPIEK